MSSMRWTMPVILALVWLKAVRPRVPGQSRLHSEPQVFQVMVGDSGRDPVSKTTTTKLLQTLTNIIFK